MNSINENNNPIYKNGLTRTQNIDEKLKKTKMHILTSECVLGGPKIDILAVLKGGSNQKSNKFVL